MRRCKCAAMVLAAKFMLVHAGGAAAAQTVILNEAREPRPLGPESTPTEVFRLGSIAGPEETSFTGPNIAVSNGPGGEVVVLDHEARVLRIFDAAGRFVREVGQPGRGPGEFSFPSGIAWGPDYDIWIPEPFEARYSIFDRNGDFLRTEPRASPPNVSRRVYPLYFEASGTLIDHFAAGDGPAFRRVEPSGKVLSTLAALGSSNLPVQRPQSDGELADAYRRHTRRLIWALGTDGTTWSAWSDELRLVQRSLKGDTIRIVEARHRRPNVAPKERDLLDRLEREYRDVELAPRVVQSIHVAPDGRVLVQISDGGRPLGSEVDVFNADGSYAGTFETPVPIQPLAQSHISVEYFSFVGVGPYDIPVVVRLRLTG